ncbi:hypothetical protein B9Z50_11280 [Limnohabitans sp. Bal53]|nr:hypothetical protein B9Z50_11280 [Limnohabitans sp. Bal53]
MTDQEIAFSDGFKSNQPVIKSWFNYHANLPYRARWYPKMRPSGNQSVKRQPTPWWAFLSLIYDHLQGDS